MRLPTVATKLVGGAVLAGLTFVAIQTVPAQAAVPDRTARGEMGTFTGHRDGGRFDLGDRRYEAPGGSCVGPAFGRWNARQVDCSADRRVDTRSSTRFVQDHGRSGWGDDRGAPRRGDR